MGDLDDDHVWLEALAGRDAAESPTQREASALRRAVLARAGATARAPAHDHDQQREAQLLERAQREGLTAPRRSSLRDLFSWNRGFALAVIAVIAVAAGLYVQRSMDPEVVRGAPGSIVRLEAADPVGLKQQIIDELRIAGVEATGYELLGRQGLDADLPLPLSDAVRAVLERHRIPAPQDGVLRVEIAQRPAQ